MIVLIVLFVVMLLAPVVGSAAYYKKRKGTVLYINQNRVRDPRYFAESFSNMIRSSWPSASDHTIKLSREELFIDQQQLEKEREKVAHLVICREIPFRSPEDIIEFEKEIYSVKDAVFDRPGLCVRGAYTENRMIVGNDTTVIRWIDAEKTLAVYDNCNLGISATAGERLSIGKNCRFQRLFAPEILAGQYPGGRLTATDGRNPKIYRLPIQTEKKDNICYISKEDINEEGIAPFSVQSWENVIVTEGVIVQGDIRSHRGVRLQEGAVVCGNIFSEKEVYLERHATVLGCIFSQEDIELEENVVVGQKGRICSVIARHHITIEKNCFIFGYVSCERGGWIAAQGEEKWQEPYRFLEEPSDLVHLRFQDLYEYEHVDQQGFRRAKRLQDLVIPVGAEKIAKSMFFDCEKLQKAQIPASLREIGSYAFADCRSLREVPGLSESLVEAIGNSAFENCQTLTEIVLPASVKEMGEAAFAGCTKLGRIVFAQDGVLESIGDHCFHGCQRLESLYLPDTVKKIGISAFLDCGRLKRISLPEVCRQEPGICALQKQNPEMEWEFRTTENPEGREGEHTHDGGEVVCGF